MRWLSGAVETAPTDSAIPRRRYDRFAVARCRRSPSLPSDAPGLSLRPAAAQQGAAAGYATDHTATADSTRAPHYEWQYHYVGRHARYEGRWVLVR